MSILLHRRESVEENCAEYFSGLYDRFLDVRLERTMQYIKIKGFLTPVVYQKKFKRGAGYTRTVTNIDDTISRATIWKTLFKDEPLPDTEENAVERYAGSLDRYLPEDVPIDKIVRHAKG